MAGAITNVTDETFQAEVLEADTPVLVDFWAPWCHPCVRVAPILEELNSERDDLRVVKLNIDDNSEIAHKYGVLSIPTMILFKHGNPAATVVGALPKRRIVAELEPALA
jgi:thioredoxin 1